ncbi:hypothetical protein WJX72_012149 [[Myrmecia] bisecta]|uniref:Probable cytosolic iron-sulfur protein assembly protein CIAO1 homolog n=1 Tax=[Myrmecia] bisecta TaxID=41462 RepID=A0AAW1PBF3_9CHLO
MGTLEELQTLEGHSDRVWSVRWSPSGDMLASCSGDKTVRIWTRQRSSGRWACCAFLEESHHRTVRSCSWSPDGRYLATGSFDATTAIWERQDGVWEQVATLEGHENEVKGVAWSPSGSLLATCSRDKTVWLWESLPMNEYECVDVKHGHSQDVKMVAWHPKGEVLASCSYDDTIKLWVDSDDEWICVQTLAGPGIGHTSTVWAVAFEVSGARMVSCSDDLTLRVWSCNFDDVGEPNWKLQSVISGYHTRTIFSVDWSPQGAIATGSADNAIRIFTETGTSPDTGVPGQPTFSLAASKESAHLSDVNGVHWHPKLPGLLASAGDEGVIKLWQFTPAELLSLHA